MAKKIELGNGTSFKSQKEATLYFQNILHSDTCEVLIPREHPSFSDVLSLYKRHPEFFDKSTSEERIKEFLIKNSGQYHTRCFHSVHYDGSISDWSYKTAITGTPKSLFQSFTDAARSLLESSEYKFRDACFSKKCRLFIESKGYSIESFPKEWISKPAQLQYRAELTDFISVEFICWYERNKE
ncbi:MAG: hypothetical protein SwBeaMacB_17620 [Shewanella algae]|uniref:DUF3223 domain-containing protein n=1 Tax=Shewanella algae TaxID=38313 RepID=UPI0031F50F4D